MYYHQTRVTVFHHISDIKNIAVVIVITKNDNRASHYRAATDSFAVSGPSQDHT